MRFGPALLPLVFGVFVTACGSGSFTGASGASRTASVPTASAPPPSPAAAPVPASASADARPAVPPPAAPMTDGTAWVSKADLGEALMRVKWFHIRRVEGSAAAFDVFFSPLVNSFALTSEGLVYSSATADPAWSKVFDLVASDLRIRLATAHQITSDCLDLNEHATAAQLAWAGPAYTTHHFHYIEVNDNAGDGQPGLFTRGYDGVSAQNFSVVAPAAGDCHAADEAGLLKLEADLKAWCRSEASCKTALGL